ncbi:hypothetical protein JWH11_00885 [Xanthomonas melonis]|uniref:DUF4405 domain-containing protein n=1 Tax=Xanthomonas melonis TaxID=56456 RepID=A0ABS8NPM4_9XANT|nr:hypothetical protein [Xanthomonas melonis]MCD0256740.1 hypothetical protein [Xanthomonas melonis]MCD0265016.1 hypothetical protein [Xanthomonas melonis]
MDKAIFPHDAHWYRSAENLHSVLIVAVLTLALAASLLVLGCRTAFTGLLRLVHYAAIVWKKLRNQDKRSAKLRQLSQTIFSITALMLLLAVIAAHIPLMMRLVMQLPELWLVFGFQLITAVLHSCSINHDAGRLRDPITVDERSA